MNGDRMIQAHGDTPLARGRRLKQLRAIANMTRDELAERTGVSRASISYWENATYSGLSHKGAEKIVAAMIEKGVQCTIGWLLLGLGIEPYVIDRRGEPSVALSSDPQKGVQRADQEIALFTSLYPQAVVIEVSHAGMSPVFEPGDRVGGIWQTVEPRGFQPRHSIIREGDVLQLRWIPHHDHCQIYAPVVRLWRSA